MLKAGKKWMLDVIFRQYKFIDILLKQPNINWKKLSCNVNLNINHTLANPKKPWDWFQLTKRPDIATLENLLKYSGKGKICLDWCSRGIHMNPGITIEMMKKHFPRYLDNMWNLCRNPNITMDMIPSWSKTYVYIDNGQINFIIRGSKIVIDFLNKYLVYFKPYIKEASMDPYITMEFIEQNLDKKWDWDLIALNPNVTWKWLCKFHKLANAKWSNTAILLSSLSTKDKLWFLKID